MSTILIHGYTGKLGKAIYDDLSSDYDLIGCNQTHSIHIALSQKKPDIILDVTSAKAISQHLVLYQHLKIPTIIGTSGISPKQAKILIQKADFPLLIVPNFSLSFQSFASACYKLSQYADSIHIEETHHKSKVDSPSGSSLFLADALQTRDITSYRVDEYIAKHTVIFQHSYHNLSLSHTITSPQDFLPGVRSALQILQEKTPTLVLFSDS